MLRLRSNLAAVSAITAPRQNWRVSADLYLCTLAYSKMAICEDLQTDAWLQGVDHAMVRFLTGLRPSPTRHEVAPAAPCQCELIRLAYGTP